MGYFVFTLNGVIEKVNNSAARMLGEPKDRIEGKPFVTFLTEFGSGEFFLKHLSDVAKTKAAQIRLLELKSSKAGSLWIKLMTVSVVDEAAAIIGFSSAVLEVTDLAKFK